MVDNRRTRRARLFRARENWGHGGRGVRTGAAKSGTVLVGAVCPWIPGFDEGLAIVADCRTSYVHADGVTADPHYVPFDRTKKILPLGRYAAGGFTGTSAPALKALGYLAEGLFYRVPQPPWNEETVTLFESLCSRAVLPHSGTKAQAGHFQALVGFIDAAGRSRLVEFQSQTRAVVDRGLGPVLLGSGSAFAESFGRNLYQGFEGSHVPTFEMYSMALSQAAVVTFFRHGTPDPFVGGGIQKATVTLGQGYRDNYRLFEYEVEPGQEDSIPSDLSDWRGYTPSELTPYDVPQRRKGTPQ